MRDYGVYPAAHSAFLLNLGLETLSIRMERYCQNALKVAEYLNASNKIQSATYPGLPSDKYHELANKYLKDSSGVISCEIKGGRENAVEFINALKMVSIETHVADIRTSDLHPASTTHRQLTAEQLVEAGISDSLIRLSIGLEHIDDILKDIGQALDSLS